MWHLKSEIKKYFPFLTEILQLIRFPRRWWKRKILKNSVFVYESELAMASLFPKQLIDKTMELFHPASVLDLGCGTGKALAYFYAKGLDAMGVEGSKLAISKSEHPQLIKHFNLTKELNLNRKFELIWSFEFVEHIHPRYINNLLQTFSHHSDHIVLSAALPGQGGEGHFNENTCEYWIAQFQKYNYRYDPVKTNALREVDEIYSQNIIVFERNQSMSTTPEIK